MTITQSVNSPAGTTFTYVLRKNPGATVTYQSPAVIPLDLGDAGDQSMADALSAADALLEI